MLELRGATHMGSREKMDRFRSTVLANQEEAAASDVRRWLAELLDEDSFVELGSSQAQSAADGLVTGYGQIDGRMVVVSAQDASARQGGVGLSHVRRYAQTIELALKAGAPLISLLDAGGLLVDEGLPLLTALAELYQDYAAAREIVPTVAVVLGPCPGSLSFLPAQSDIVIVAEDRGGIYLQGPGITSAEEGKGRSPSAIGGAQVHATASGLATMTAPDASAALVLARQTFALLPDDCTGFDSPVSDEDPNRSAESLDELAAALDSGFDAAAVMDAVFDAAPVLPLWADFAPELDCRLAALGGAPVLVAATAGPELGTRAAAKLEKLTALAERFSYPLVTFAHLDGFAAGASADADGISAAAARMFSLFAGMEAAPRVAVVCGRQIGAALLAFNSRLNGADFVFAWPTAEIGLLRPDAAVALFLGDELAASSDPIARRPELEASYSANEMGAANAVAAGLVDEVILPSATRPRLYSALQTIAGLR
ncbi:MAG: carboxyl transferase domain-containing protein [Bacillota bacterium]|nr:carboxyl transferase domain-containing protein [Bacillota bacterium]